jgi:hypothetical protein
MIGFFVAGLGGFWLICVVCVILNFWRGAALFVLLLLIALWFVAFCVTALWLQRFPCPRCGKPFLHPFYCGRDRHKFLDMKQCIHCGLPWFGDAKA